VTIESKLNILTVQTKQTVGCVKAAGYSMVTQYGSYHSPTS